MRQVLIGLILVFAWAAPPVLAKSCADTLDRGPYWICLLVGIAIGAMVCVLAWPTVRTGLLHAGTSPRSWGGTVLLLTIAFCPTWSIGAGLGVNRACDRSPAVPHECRVLEWQRPANGSARCLVTSWRGRDHEVLGASEVLAGLHQPDSAVLMSFPQTGLPGATVVVYSRAGRLGWEWIERVAPP